MDSAGCLINRIINNPPPCSTVKTAAAVANGIGFTGQAYAGASVVLTAVTAGTSAPVTLPYAALVGGGGTLLRFGAYVATTLADHGTGCLP